MTTIEIKPNKIYVYGHSGYDVIGKDIVCAAISTLTEATYNYLLVTQNNVKCEESNGVYIINLLNLNKNGEQIILCFENMINDLIRQYPRYLRRK